jgi:hypothetical protein
MDAARSRAARPEETRMRSCSRPRRQLNRCVRPVAATAAATVGALVGTLFVVDAAGAQEPPQPQAQGNVFPISGSASGLAPGVERELLLTVGNPFDWSITVTRLTVQVSDSTAVCRASDLQVSDFNGRLVIPRHQERTQAVTMMLRGDSPDSCQEQRWPLSFGGQAMRTYGEPRDASHPGIDALAFTGSPIAKLLAVAFLMLAAGLVTLLVRRRSTRTAPTRDPSAAAGSDSS